jgi:hypothetical protein
LGVGHRPAFSVEHSPGYRQVFNQANGQFLVLLRPGYPADAETVGHGDDPALVAMRVDPNRRICNVESEVTVRASGATSRRFEIVERREMDRLQVYAEEPGARDRFALRVEDTTENGDLPLSSPCLLHRGWSVLACRRRWVFVVQRGQSDATAGDAPITA